MLNVALPKGRLGQKVYDMFEKAGFDCPSIKEENRKLIFENKEKGLPFPKLYQWCGTEDRLLDENRRYHALLEQLEIPHKYEESEGNHSWKWWDLHIQDALRYFFET